MEKSPVTSDENPFRYCGEYFDKESGTIYLRARYYAPGIGRFTSEDTYRGNKRDPLSLNLYTYAHNNPVRFINPSGHAVTEWDKANLSNSELAALAWITMNWNNANAAGNQTAMANLHAQAVAIRTPYLQSNQSVNSSGYVQTAPPVAPPPAAPPTVPQQSTAQKPPTNNNTATPLVGVAGVTDKVVVNPAIGTGNAGAVQQICFNPYDFSKLDPLLRLLDAATPTSSGKWVGNDGEPFRIMIHQWGHAPTPNFTGTPAPYHEIPHWHLERYYPGTTKWNHSNSAIPF